MPSGLEDCPCGQLGYSCRSPTYVRVGYSRIGQVCWNLGLGKSFQGQEKLCPTYLIETNCSQKCNGGEAVQNTICSITVKCVYNNARVQSPSLNASLFSFYKDCECVNLVIEFVCITGP